MGWSFIECVEVLERFKSLPENLKKYILFYTQNLKLEFGKLDAPKGRNGGPDGKTLQVDGNKVLLTKGMPHPVYKDIYFQNIETSGLQRWTRGQWFYPKAFSKKYAVELLGYKLKWCKMCRRLLTVESFRKRTNRNGLTSRCIKCSEIQSRIHAKTESGAEYYRRYSRNRDKKHAAAIARKSYLKNKERFQKRDLEWRKNNPEKVKETALRSYKKRRQCPARVIRDRLANLLNYNIKRTIKLKESGTIDHVGCSSKKLLERFEKQIGREVTEKDLGKNYNIDHIIPMSVSFQIYDRKLWSFKKCQRLIRALWHYSNLQLLHWKVNQHEKSDSIGDEKARYMGDADLIKIAEELIVKTESIRKLDTKKAHPKSEL